jgi:hypothetical protein
MRTERKEGLSIDLDTIHGTQDGFIARHVQTNLLSGEVVSLRWWRNGNARFAIPMPTLQVTQYDLPSDPVIAALLEFMRARGVWQHRLLDLGLWLTTLLALTARFLELRAASNISAPIWGKIVFSNARGWTPFISMNTFIEVIRKNGVPVVQDNINLYPADAVDSFVSLPNDPAKEDFVRVFELICPLAINGMKALGVMFDYESKETLGKEILEAVSRKLTQKPSPK